MTPEPSNQQEGPPASAATPARGWPLAAPALALAATAAAALLDAGERLGHAGLALLAGGISAGLFVAGRRRHARTGGARGQLLACTAVLLVPVAAHGAARALGFGLPFARTPATAAELLTGPWFPVLSATALAAALAWRALRVPFLVTPIAGAAWFSLQDAAPLLLGGAPDWSQRAPLSMLCGLALVAAGLLADRRARREEADWLHLAGLLALTGGAVTWTGVGDLALLLLLALHAGLVVVSLALERRAFAVAGALGLASAAGRLADDLLEASAVTSVAVALALALAALGALYHRHQPRLAATVRTRLPRRLRGLLPPAR